jgi:hypothetical protein
VGAEHSEGLVDVSAGTPVRWVERARRARRWRVFGRLAKDQLAALNHSRTGQEP